MVLGVLRYALEPDTRTSTALTAPLSLLQACLPDGQAKAFPSNYFSAMTATGAKGSLVNFSQISCLLGQQVRQHCTS